MARMKARCPHSGFAVGAALLDDAGQIWTGANVESASYPLGLCAERVALFHAVTHGAGAIETVVVLTDAVRPTSPCGGCRQILWELAPRATVHMVTAGGAARSISVAELLPDGFDASSLTEKP